MQFLDGQRGVFSKVVLGFRNFAYASKGLGEIFEGDFADTCTEKIIFVSMGGRLDLSRVRTRGAKNSFLPLSAVFNFLPVRVVVGIPNV